jgi:biopolymer transport protein ExbB
MRRYATSRLRIGVLVFLLAAAFVAGGRALGQSEPAAGPAESTGSTAVQTGQEMHRTNPFRLLMRQDTLTDFVFWTIVICSVIGVSLIIQGFIKVKREAMIPQSSTNRMRELISQRQFKELLDFTETDSSFVSKALNPALKRAPHFAAMKDAMETAVAEQTAEQFRRIEYLNIIGNLGPLLGLLGTVFGMIDAFQSLSAAQGNASPAQLSGGISLALTHTMLGLMLAIPCLAAFGVLRTMVDRLTVQGALIAEDLLLMVKPAEARPVTAPVIPPRPVASPQPETRLVDGGAPKVNPSPLL